METLVACLKPQASSLKLQAASFKRLDYRFKSQATSLKPKAASDKLLDLCSLKKF